MSRLPKALARRIDRLSRHAHAFHRYAHHPLCTAYAGELVVLRKRTRVCRGCSFATLGLGAGVVAGSVAHPTVWTIALVGALAGALIATSFVVRLPKVLSRLLPGVLAGAALAGALQANPIRAFVVTLTLALGAMPLLAWYRARGPDRSPCARCPERHGPSPCSGLRPIVLRERAFQRLADRWIRMCSSAR